MGADAMMSELKGRGYRVTGKRREILEYMITQDRYISGRELIAHLRSKYPTLSLETVYRNLKTLCDEGMIEESRFEGNEGKYRVACQPPHHHHYICVRCGRTMMIEGCPMTELANIPDGFTVIKHRFEVLGYCASCKSKADEKSL